MFVPQCLCGFQESRDLPAIWRSIDAVVLAKASEISGTRRKAGFFELFRRHLGGAAAEAILDAALKTGGEFIAFPRWKAATESGKGWCFPPERITA